jgi:hypothetical protein
VIAFAISLPRAACEGFESDGMCNWPFSQMPLFIPAPAAFPISSNGLNPTTRAEITSPVSVEKIGAATISSTISPAAPAVSTM